MATNPITGDSIATKIGNKEAQKNFENNFDRIFGKKETICNICGKDFSNTKECGWTSCPLNWDEKRLDVIGQNGNDGLHYGK